MNRPETDGRDLFAIADLAREFGISTRARIAWRTEKDMGVAFLDAAPQAPGAEIVPLSYAKRLRDCEKEREALRRRLDGDFIG